MYPSQRTSLQTTGSGGWRSWTSISVVCPQMHKRYLKRITNLSCISAVHLISFFLRLSYPQMYTGWLTKSEKMKPKKYKKKLWQLPCAPFFVFMEETCLQSLANPVKKQHSRRGINSLFFCCCQAKKMHIHLSETAQGAKKANNLIRALLSTNKCKQ